MRRREGQRGARGSDKAAAAAGGAQGPRERIKDGGEDGDLARGSSWHTVRAELLLRGRGWLRAGRQKPFVISALEGAAGAPEYRHGSNPREQTAGITPGICR